MFGLSKSSAMNWDTDTTDNVTYVWDADSPSHDVRLVHPPNGRILLQPHKLSSNAGDVAMLHVLDVGHHQTRGGCHGHPYVVRAVLEKSIRFVIQAAVDYGKLL